MYDFHLHSEYSIDSKTSMENMVLSAINKNFKSICFTDHIDFEANSLGIDFVFRTPDYLKNIKQVKYKYKNQLEILAGVEIGMQPHLANRYNSFIEEGVFDFVIMSVHTLDGLDISSDNYTKGKSPLEAIERYYNEMYLSISNFDNFDVLGHIDYIDRYFEDYSLIPKFDEYAHQVEEILKLLIQKGKGIEINTGGMRYGLSYYHPKLPILKMYKELGGEIITIGSDAHKPEDIGHDYKIVERMLKDLGFKYIHIFKERKKFPINIL